MKKAFLSALLATVLAATLCPVAGHAAEPPPVNPWLANSNYPLPHGDAGQQDASYIAGPLDRSRRLGPEEIDYVHLGPAHFGAFISGPYPDGRRVIWSNGVNGVYKVDHDSFELLAHLPPDDVGKIHTEADADASIARFDHRNEGFRAILNAFRDARVLRDLSGVYTMVDRDNLFYVGHKSGRILVYGDAVANDPESAIELKGRFDFPPPVTGNLIGINMTFDGWITTVTEHGYLVLVSRDLKTSRHIRLRHSEAAEAASGRTGYGWVRNAFAIDRDGGIYIASRDHMHKLVWDGDRASIDEADGAWTVPYPNSTGEGTGATPSLMGFGREDRFVVLTDGDVLMNVLLMWRDGIPQDWAGFPGQPRRIAGMAPASMGVLDLKAIQSEQSVVTSGYGALVVNNQPRNQPWYLPDRANRLLVSFLGSSPRYQPFGVQKFEWNPAKRQLESAWVAEEISSPNCVPIVSPDSGMVYLIGARNNQWTLEAIDWSTGKPAFHYVIGGQRYNSLFAGTIIDNAGHIIYGTPWGRARIRPRATAAGTASE